MGRYYYGDISGKFWVACQSSTDASNYGITHKDIINFCVCHCASDETEESIGNDPEKKIYCESCYDSYEQHIESIKEEDLDLDSENIKTWYISESEICYEFCEEHIEQLEEKIKELEKKVGKYMNTFKIIEKNEEINYDFDSSYENLDGNAELVARLCLGKQIHYCLKKKGSCIFFAEC